MRLSGPVRNQGKNISTNGDRIFLSVTFKPYRHRFPDPTGGADRGGGCDTPS